MVLGIHTAYRCKECGEVFFQRKDDIKTPSLLTKVLCLPGVGACPRCGSRKVFEDKTIRT